MKVKVCIDLLGITRWLLMKRKSEGDIEKGLFMQALWEFNSLPYRTQTIMMKIKIYLPRLLSDITPMLKLSKAVNPLFGIIFVHPPLATLLLLCRYYTQLAISMLLLYLLYLCRHVQFSDIVNVLMVLYYCMYYVACSVSFKLSFKRWNVSDTVNIISHPSWISKLFYEFYDNGSKTTIDGIFWAINRNKVTKAKAFQATRQLQVKLFQIKSTSLNTPRNCRI